MKKSFFKKLGAIFKQHINLHNIVTGQEKELNELRIEVNRLRNDIPYMIDYQQIVKKGEKPLYTDVDGNLYICDCIEKYVKFSQKDYALTDPGIIRVLPKIVSDNAIIFDVGAHIGGFCIPAAKQIVGSRVFAFEPERQNFELLVENIKLNNLLSSIEPVQKAVYSTTQDVELYVFPRSASSWTSLANYEYKNNAPIKTETVRAVSLDSFVDENNIPTIDLLKIDVEGFEAEVFNGAKNLLAADKINYIIFEISQTPLRKSGHTVMDTLEPLIKIGLRFYSIDETGLISEVTKEDIIGVSFGNFIACRKKL
jgi:FkbM family methyltransferase